MGISPDQINEWANIDDTTDTEAALESIQNVLAGHNWPFRMKYKIYLQGAYRNKTNIPGSTDIDIVVEFTNTFRRNVSQLTNRQKTWYADFHAKARYTWESYRKEVYTVLENQFGKNAIQQGNKSIKVTNDAEGWNANILVCYEYRHYTSYTTDVTSEYKQGITFQTWEGKRIINFPGLHYGKGIQKMSQAKNLPDMIRIFKHARNELGEQFKDITPSFFLESLLHNVPDHLFSGNNFEDFHKILEYLSTADLSRFKQQNENENLIGDVSGQWPKPNAEKFIKGLPALIGD